MHKSFVRNLKQYGQENGEHLTYLKYFSGSYHKTIQLTHISDVLKAKIIPNVSRSPFLFQVYLFIYK